MILVTHLFPDQEEYQKLLCVFKESAFQTMSGVNIKIVETERPVLTEEQTTNHREVHHYYTSQAFIDLANVVLDLNEEVAVCDVDLMFLRSVNDFWAKYPHADMAFTRREYKHPLNTGIWFYRPTKNSKRFVKKWIQYTKDLTRNFAKGKRKLINLDSGIDQASLRLTMETCPKISRRWLPCVEWNATQSEWHHITPDTRVIHVKSLLRDVIMGRKELPESREYLQPIVDKWKRHYEASLR